MTPRDHFKDVDAAVIHLPSATEREAQVKEVFKDTFRTLQFIEPLPPRDPVQVRLDYYESKQNDPDWMIFDREYILPEDFDKWRKMTNSKYRKGYGFSPVMVANSDSLRRTSLKLMQDFIHAAETGQSSDRLVILEDDACPRDGFLDDFEFDMPEDAHIICWGGAVVKTQQDGHDFTDRNKPFELTPFGIHTADEYVDRLICAHCYEVDVTGAKWLADRYSKAGALDDLWAKALLAYGGTYRMQPQGVVQVSHGSTIDPKQRGFCMPIHRDQWFERKGWFGGTWRNAEERPDASEKASE